MSLSEEQVIKLIDENRKKYLASLSISDRIIYAVALLYVRLRDRIKK